ncbi:AAA family ATPase [Sphingomonas oligophenolica]|uniref:Chromosome partitioning protein n=1 Tax=Sphingomonas oligophenolica TaxID=301154 RepID=A0A502CFH9_9SPHN|nr:chromosome partitioning protein [Sphingomonas oligophenolica]
MKPHPTTPAKPRRDESLLERAAKVYDFGAHARARRTAIDDVTPEPLSFDALATPATPPESAPVDDPTFLAIPPELRAEVGHELPDGFYGAPEISDIASIDRGMLAQAGMIVPGAPVGPLAEEFRLVKRQLLITGARIAEAGDPDKARTVLVCSAKPGEGKTFCAINLALSLAAERDTEVLLVDADFAKPDVLAQLGLADSPGFLDALADSSIDVESLVLRTDVGGLAILPAGTKMATDTELLASARTRAVLARLLAANPRRIIIFDSPPALAASPASVLAMLVGQVMLVVRADRTPESDLKQAVGLLDACDHISLALNAVAFVPGGQRFGSYYGQEMSQ